MNKAYKYRIYPTEEQKILFAKTFGCVRFIYNKMLEDKIKYHEETKTTLYCYPSQYKKEFEWLKEVDSLALVGADNQLKTAFKNFFTQPKVGFPKFKSKRSNHSYTTNMVNNNIKLGETTIKLPKVGEVRIKKHRTPPEHYILKSVTVSKTPTEKYYVSVLFEYDEKIQDKDLKSDSNYLGLDFSMKELFVASDGTSAKYPRYYRQAQEKLLREQRKLSKMQKGSNNRNKQRITVARLHKKVANQRKDFLHKISKQITNVYDCICVEDLNMKAMSQALNFGKSVSDNGWGMFINYLKYKLEDQGKKLIKIDKFFPSSKMCSCCYEIKKDLKLSDRIYHCEACGMTLDRDYNASLNIREEGKRIALA